MARYDAIIEKILVYLVPHGADCTVSLSPEWNDHNKISFNDISQAIGTSPEEFIRAVEYMVKNDLAKYHCIKSSSGPVPIGFYLTHEGLHYKEIRRLTSQEKWKERIIGFASGLLVAVCGALILSKLGI